MKMRTQFHLLLVLSGVLCVLAWLMAMAGALNMPTPYPGGSWMMAAGVTAFVGTALATFVFPYFAFKD